MTETTNHYKNHHRRLRRNNNQQIFTTSRCLQADLFPDPRSRVRWMLTISLTFGYFQWLGPSIGRDDYSTDGAAGEVYDFLCRLNQNYHELTMFSMD